MDIILSIEKIMALGFEWPHTTTIQAYAVVENGKVNMDKTLAHLRQSFTFYNNQITAAYNFKTQTGADYSDFTDKFDDYVRMERQLREAIHYMEQIQIALSKSQPVNEDDMSA